MVLHNANPIKSIIWDGAEYWAICGSRLFRGATIDALVESDDPSDDKYNDILYDSTRNLYYLSSNNGNVFRYNPNSDAWDSPDEEVEIGGEAVSFTALAQIQDNILVGTHGYGFFQMLNGTLGSLTRAGDGDGENEGSLIGTDLFDSHVLSFKIAAPDLVFFCTGGDGLYHNTFDGTEWSSDWVRE